MQVGRGDPVAACHQKGAADGIPQLADVARPGILSQGRLRQPVETLHPLVVFLREVPQKETGQRKDVLRALRERRDADGELVQTVE